MVKRKGMSEVEFGKMVDAYEKLVYTICYQFTRNHHTAQDLAQETFLSAYRHLDACPEGNEKPWLARIAANKAKDHLKSAYNRRVTAVDKEKLEVGRGTLFLQEFLPEEIAIGNEKMEYIVSEIEALREPYLKVAKLYFLEEKSVEEIAHLLQRPQKTVHTQIYRTRCMLREKWKEGELSEVVLRGRAPD